MRQGASFGPSQGQKSEKVICPGGVSHNNHMEGKRNFLIGIIIFWVVIFALLFYLFYSIQAEKKLEVIFLDIGQGDSALIKFGNGQKMLVDCGPDKKVLSKLSQYLSFFDRTIDYMLVTHPDGDHYGGCPAVLERYEVRNIIFDDFKKSNDPFWRAWTKYSAQENTNWKFIDGPEIMNIGTSRLEFFSPDSRGLVMKKDADEANNHSIVFLLQNSLGRFLFTGDMEAPLEDAILQKYCAEKIFPCPSLQADYLKVGHHGSESSSGVEFLKAVSARYGIVSAGVKNRYGHPSQRVLRKLERAKMQIWRTDMKGDIIIETKNFLSV